MLSVPRVPTPGVAEHKAELFLAWQDRLHKNWAIFKALAAGNRSRTYSTCAARRGVVDKRGSKNSVADRKKQKILLATHVHMSSLKRRGLGNILETDFTHKKPFLHRWPDYAVGSKAHLNQHVLREGVEVLASVLLWVALSGAAGAYYHPVIVEPFKDQRQSWSHVNIQMHL